MLRATNYELSGCLLQEALTKISINHPDIALIEINQSTSLPSFFLKLQQALSPDQGIYQPILVGFTSKKGVEERIRYYNMGFDLVIEYPISTEFLIARINALTRRIRVGTNTIQSAHLMMDKMARDCFVKTAHGELLSFFKVTPMQFEILILFIRYPRRVWGRGELEAILSHQDHSLDYRAIDTAINRLRERVKGQLQKLPANSWEVKPPYREPFIHTEYGTGYYFLDCLQFRQELSTASISRPRRPVRQGGLKIHPDPTLQFPFNIEIENCAYSLDSQAQ